MEGLVTTSPYLPVVGTIGRSHEGELVSRRRRAGGSP